MSFGLRGRAVRALKGVLLLISTDPKPPSLISM
jgi:hypothetical protein